MTVAAQPGRPDRGAEAALPPRVVVLVTKLNIGGAERIAAKLANGLASCGHAVTLAVVAAGGEYERLPEPAVERVCLLEDGGRWFAAWPPARAAAALIALIGLLRRRRPVAVFPLLDYANFLALAAALVIRPQPLVFPTICSNLVAQRRHARGLRLRLRFAIAAALSRLLLPRAGKVLAVSQGVARDLRAALALPEEKLLVIDRAPVVDEAFRRGRASGPPHPWLRDPAIAVIVAVGRLDEVKDYPTLLRALPMVRARRPVRLIVVGNGRLQPSLVGLAATLGLAEVVDFVGFQRHPEAYLSHCDAYVLCSLWECLPTALIEALACGAPVVSTRCPHGPEEILEGGRWGRLVPVGDARALAEALIAALDEPRSMAARAHFERLHAASAHTAAYAALVAWACGRPGEARAERALTEGRAFGHRTDG